MYEKSDIETWAFLGLYFAHKLRSAVSYQEYLNSGSKQSLRQAVSHLEKATGCWEQVSGITTGIYHVVPLQHYNRNEDKYFHWNKVRKEVLKELEWLKNQAR